MVLTSRTLKETKHKKKSGETTKRAISPGQIFLFGEHAVVYGEPALATAIDAFTTVEAEEERNPRIQIQSKGVGSMEGIIVNENGNWSIKDRKGDVEALRFVSKSIELVFDYYSRATGLTLRIDSDIPTGSGLGSSSAVTTATVAAVSSVLGEKLSHKQIAEIAYSSELEVQGAASRTGVNVATFGGFLRVEEDKFKEIKNLPELSVTIGYTGIYGDTGSLVGEVRKLRKTRPEITDTIIETIGEITDIGIDTLRGGNMKKFGVLINANQNLLEALGVSSPEIRGLIKATRNSGAIGAKLTGAGGGGCMIAITPKDSDNIAKVIQENGCEPIKAKIGVGGLRY